MDISKLRTSDFLKSLYTLDPKTELVSNFLIVPSSAFWKHQSRAVCVASVVRISIPSAKVLSSYGNFHTHFHRNKGILTLGRMGVKFEK